ncbi:MAG: hypothetical protein H0U92_03440 [Actinobacteria bacterium]|nr:hypothetical protein [Actinomycetota bacterium]
MRQFRLLIFAFVAVAFAGAGCNNASNKSSAGDPGHPKAGEIFLEALSVVGRNPFTKSVAFSAVPDIGTGSIAGASGKNGIRSVRGSTAGLYAGSASQPVCDTTALVTLLGDDGDRAQAWVDALNDDTTLQWSGGAKLSVDDITAFVGELTSVFVRSDTRVTDHGLLNNRDVGFQSVLQKGTAVLVDSQGLPRTRCASGSPLTAPEPATRPKYRGEEWADFSQRRLVIVVPAARALDTLRILDIHSREIIEISPGSGCLCDRTLQTTPTSTTLFDETTTTTTTTTKRFSTTTPVKRPTTSGVAATTTTPATSPTTTPATTTPSTTDVS